MERNTAPEKPEVAVGAARVFSVSAVGQLDEGETLTGTPVITEVDDDNVAVSPSSLTITSIAVNTTALVIGGKTVPIGEAVQFKVSGHSADTDYRLRITCDTVVDGVATEGLVFWVRFKGSNG